MRILIIILSILVVLLTSVHILLHKREPRAAILWLGLVWANPIVGFVAYWLMGYNRARDYVRKRSHHRQEAQAPADAEDCGQGLMGLRRLGGLVTGRRMKAGNRITPLVNGARAYPVMLRAIHRARRSVALSTYLFDSDSVGARFAGALARAARRGVEVRVLIDGPAALALSRGLRRELREAGARLKGFWSGDRWFNWPMLNLRNHRKLLIVDGETGFTGGMNISERYLKGAIQAVKKIGQKSLGLAAPGPRARDLHFLVRGPVVADMMEVFAADWLVAGREILGGHAWFPGPEAAGGAQARGVASGPDQAMERNLELLLGALRAARKRVDLCTPYFIPDQTLKASLRAAAMSGVKVRLLIPRHNNRRFVAWASRAYYAMLLKAGVEILEIEGGFVHTKAAVIDGQWCLVGSSNLDPRSFRLNFEFNLEVCSRRLARSLLGLMDHYARNSVKVSLKGLRREKTLVRLRNSLAKLLTPYI